MTTYKVRFWDIAQWKQKARPYGVRWVTEGRQHSEWFVTRALADNQRSQLVQAARAGEACDVASGLPSSGMRRKNTATLVELAREYAAMKWPDQAVHLLPPEDRRDALGDNERDAVTWPTKPSQPDEDRITDSKISCQLRESPKLGNRCSVP